MENTTFQCHIGDKTLRGVAQANATGRSIHCLPGLPPVAQLYTSTMPRALETATVIANHVNIERKFDRLLVECNPNTDENRISEAFTKHFQNIDYTGQTHILVCHSNLMRCFICR